MWLFDNLNRIIFYKRFTVPQYRHSLLLHYCKAELFNVFITESTKTNRTIVFIKKMIIVKT